MEKEICPPKTGGITVLVGHNLSIDAANRMNEHHHFNRAHKSLLKMIFIRGRVKVIIILSEKVV